MLCSALLCIVLAASGAFARSWFDTEVKTDHASRVQQYQLQNAQAVKDDDAVVVTDPSFTGGVVLRQSLGSVASIAASPGVAVDNSYDDWQYTYPGHHVDWRGRPFIQFSYVDRQGGTTGINKFGYNAYQPIGGSWPRGQGTGCELQLGEDIGLYPNIDVRSNGRVVMGGHQTLMTGTFPLDNVIYYQGTTPFTCVYSLSTIDSSQYKTGMIGFQKDSSRLYQILIELQEWGNDTITHLIGQQGAHTHLAAPGKTNCTVFPIQYFRKMTFSAGASWVGPQTLDTVQRMAALTASRVSPKVSVVYIKYTPEGITQNNSNDQTIMYRESDSVGVTWKPKVDITPYGRMDSITYSPWVDARALYDTNDKLHIVWNARPIPQNPYGNNFSGWNLLTIGASIFHWSNATGAISRVYNGEWEGLADLYTNGDLCGFIGTNMLNTGAESISECNGHLYVTWVMANDPNANPPLLNDCISGGGNLLDARFKANGEIHMSVSSDLTGLLWDKNRNLTNSPTPGCDSAGFGGVCMNDVKPTMSRYGMDVTSFDTNSVPVTLIWPDTGVNPGPGPYTGNHYTHLFYVEDHWPGNKGIENAGNTPQGNWVLNPLKWMRLACVAPISAPQIDYSPKTLGYANKDWTKHGKPDTTIVTVRNDGNATLNVTSVGMIKTTLPGTDWLGVTATSLTVNAGTSNTQTFGLIVNKGGAVNTPGTIVALTGEVYLKSNVADPQDSVSVKITNFLVADTLVGLKWDTVTTGCTRLIVSNNGDVGRLGAGTLNMDYVALGGECVSTASTYAYDGGPIVIRKSGANYIYSNALFQGDFVTEQSFKPAAIGSGASSIAGPGYDGFYTGTFVNKDTTVGVRRTYYAPTGVDTCNFVVQKSVFFGVGGAKTNVTVGEVVDWDIPTYTGSNNDGRVLSSKKVVYQQGLDTSTTRCQKHNRRFGSISFLGMYTPTEFAGNSCANDVNYYGAYTMLNDTLFKYDTLTNSQEGSYFWNQMSALSGLSTPPSQAKDLHMVMTYKHNIASLDSLTVFTALVSVKDGDTTALKAGLDKARKWYFGHVRGCPAGNCCTDLSIDGRTGNIDGDPGLGVDISDLSALIDYLYISFTPPPCLLSANTDGDGSGGVDISDLSALIDYLYISFTPPALCPE